MTAPRFLERLLDGADVEWKPLGEVGEFQRGKRFVKTDIVASGVPCIHYGEMYTHYGVWAERSKSFVSPALAAKLRVASKGDVIIVAAGETIEDIGNATAWLSDDDVVIHDACFSFRSILDAKYVSYFLRTNKFKEQIRGEISSGKISSISAKGLSKALVPIPCPDNPGRSLAIQGEIVRILDTFTELTAELKSELTAELTRRKKQYNHYRDKLLTFDEDETEWKALEEVAHFHNAKPHEKLVSPDGDVALLTAGFISREGKYARFVKAADVLTPALRGDVAMVMSDLPNGRALAKTFFVEENDRYAANQRVCLLTVREPTIISPKFLHYVMNRNKQLLKYDSGNDQTHLKKDWILEVKVPVPPIAEQAHIVAMLDKFDTLTTSISECLPREIELREKQYAYYRDHLLRFPKPDAEAA